MDYGRILREYEADETTTSLMLGSPGPSTLKDCKDIFLKATSYVLDESTDPSHAFRYGAEAGDKEFREELSQFLSKEYGDEVNSTDLMVTASATQGLHMIATVLCSKNCIVFMEDPSYFAAFHFLAKDLQITVIPVPCDQDGINTEELEHQLTIHRPDVPVEDKAHPFWGFIYTISVYNNPTGRTYSSSRCQKLVELARKYDVLVVAEDVYNLIHFGESVYPPKRLLAYDKPTDPDFKGNVLSNGTFSKILVPGLRLGWIEAPKRILEPLHQSNLAWGGGSLNHYASKLATAILKLGLQTQHLDMLRKVYQKRSDKVCEILKEYLPEGTTFTRPQGGFFIWIEFPKDVNTFEMLKFMVQRYKINFFPGAATSALGHCQNCARISFSFYDEDTLCGAVKTLAQGAQEFIHSICHQNE